MSAFSERYRKTWIPTQGLIVMLCAALLFLTRGQWGTAAAVFVVMQVGAVIGAAWAVRLERKIAAARARRDELPLSRR